MAARGGLYIAPADLSFTRLLTGWKAPAREFIRILWRKNVAEVAAANLSPSPGLHIFALGTETVLADIFFATQKPPPAGARVWLALDFELDEFGRIIKPVWATLKACFRVIASRHVEGGVVVEAENAGLQGGVVERLKAAGTASQQVSEVATATGGRRVVWLERFEVIPRRDVRGWIDGVGALGKLLTIRVERRRLDAP